MKSSDKLKRCDVFVEGVIFGTSDINLIIEAGLGISSIISLAFILTFLPKRLKKLKKVLD